MTERFLRREAVEHETGLARSTIYDLMAKGLFPKPVKLTERGRAVGWLSSEVDAFKQSRISNRDRVLQAAE